MNTDKKTLENDNAYEAMRGPMARKVVVTLVVALDSVPGFGNEIEDHINLIFKTNPYVLNATIPVK